MFRNLVAIYLHTYTYSSFIVPKCIHTFFKEVTSSFKKGVALEFSLCLFELLIVFQNDAECVFEEVYSGHVCRTEQAPNL